jgi:hypothetical protein
MAETTSPAVLILQCQYLKSFLELLEQSIRVSATFPEIVNNK